MKEKPFTIIFVPTAGEKVEFYINKKKLWGICTWQFFSLLFKSCFKQQTLNLKPETINRLEKAREIFLANERICKIFVAGGYVEGSFRSVSWLMQQYLIDLKVDEDLIDYEQGEGSVQTSGNIDSLMKLLVYPYAFRFKKIIIVTSWYHLYRTKRGIIKWIENYEDDLHRLGEIEIETVAVYPSLKNPEYWWNMFCEPLKIFIEIFFPSCIAKYDKKERAARKI